VTLPPPRGESDAAAILKKLAATRVAAFEAADQDRIVTLTVEGKRLSGKGTGFRLVLEVLGARADLYLVDSEASHVLALFSSARARLKPGDRYEPPSPPRGAAPLARDRSEVEERLRSARGPRRAALLGATGTTPLLVREVEWLIAREGLSEGDAYMKLRSRFEEKRPFLYLPKRGRHGLLSPLELASESELTPREHRSFSEAMAEAFSLESEARKISTLRTRLEAALNRRLERLRRLTERLESDEASLEEPALLRRLGELLLAGLSQARRTAEGKSVAIRDLFAPGEPEIEIEVDPRLSLPKNAERFFDRARRAERAAVELSKRRGAAAAEVSLWDGFQCDLRDASSAVELEALEREAEEAGLSFPSSGKPGKRRPPEALGPRSFRSHRGSAILVGRSGRSNDELTFELAKPHDLWLHAAGIPGAHVVLRVAPGTAADEREIQEAAELAAYYSKARGATAVDVIVAERRHVSRIKGAPRGLVKVASGPEVRTRRAVPRLPTDESSINK